LEAQDLARLQFYAVKKPNKNGSRIGTYELVRMNFPKDLHGLLQDLRCKNVQVKGYQEGKAIHIVLIETEKN
jgi:hypothetical protein